MNLANGNRMVQLKIPADQSYTTVATLALSGLGMVAGLDVDLLGDLRTMVGECIDCLMHQSLVPDTIALTAGLNDGRFVVRFAAQERQQRQQCDSLGLEITRGVLETLMPDVRLETDEDGVHGIECSMPV